MDFLEYSLDTGITIKDSNYLLVAEFNALGAVERNKSKDDKTGTKRYRMLKELTYIYMLEHYKSPFSKSPLKDREEGALAAIEHLPGFFELDEAVEAARKKFVELQDTKSLQLLKAAYYAVDQVIGYFTKLDLSKLDTFNKPIYNAKDVITNIANSSKLIDGLQQLEDRVKQDLSVKSSLRSDAEGGFFD